MISSIYRRYRLWHLGKAENRTQGICKRIAAFINAILLDGFGHRRFLREPYPGIMHFLIFAGCGILLLGAAIDFITHTAGLHLTGSPYLWFSLILDIGGIAVLVGTLMAIIRRYIIKPERLNTILDDSVVLSLIIVIVLTGFVIEGLRLAVTEFVEHPDWAVWSPGGYVFAKAFGSLDSDSLKIWHVSLWWLHSVLVIGAILYVSLVFSKLQHIVISPLNAFFRTLGPVAVPARIDFEHAETLGVSNAKEFTWKQLLDVDACTNCGRCQDKCPAFVSGKPLSPRKMTQDIKANWLKTARSPEPVSETETNSSSLIGVAVSEDEIWACTTCAACQETCPVYVEHIEKVIDMRRNLVMMQSKMPETAQVMLRNLQSKGHPWAGVQSLRLRGDWTSGQDLKILGDGESIDTLLWVGCTGALVDRNVNATLSLVKVLKAAGINFGVLGEAEACCGDPARRSGYEIVFQTMAEQNIAVFKAHNIKEIITACPHCYNALKNEYNQFGADLKVVHYSELIDRLLKDGSLKLKKESSAVITYHDPCYLGRYNKIYSPPRNVIKAIPRISLKEMDRSHSQSFCCGGGGGHMWIEENAGRKINEIRIEEAINTGVDTIVTSCPYCLQMLEEGIERKEAKGSLIAKDLSELVENAL